MERRIVEKQIGAKCRVCGQKFLLDQLDGIFIPRHDSSIIGLDCGGGGDIGKGLYIQVPSVRSLKRAN